MAQREEFNQMAGHMWTFLLRLKVRYLNDFHLLLRSRVCSRGPPAGARGPPGGGGGAAADWTSTGRVYLPNEANQYRM